ncbi:hypothetical protein EON67_12445, partial [archaeon]
MQLLSTFDNFVMRVGARQCVIDPADNPLSTNPSSAGYIRCRIGEQVAGYYNLSVVADTSSVGYGESAFEPSSYQVNQAGRMYNVL